MTALSEGTIDTIDPLQSHVGKGRNSRKRDGLRRKQLL